MHDNFASRAWIVGSLVLNKQVLFLLHSANQDLLNIINQKFNIDFNVPLLLEAKIGNNWLDTKDVI